MLPFNNIPHWLKNKYFLTASCFGLWMLFFDDRDLCTTYFKQRHELNELQKNKIYFESQIASTSLELHKLKSSVATLEQFAREKYLMKRSDEDLFIVAPASK